jgi:hypothetical protein
MARFEKKPYVTVGTKEWETVIPRPPKHATHARMSCIDHTYGNGEPKIATLPLNDFGCFQGVSGDFSYIRMDKKGKVSEEYDGTWYWDGNKVEGIDDLI